MIAANHPTLGMSPHQSGSDGSPIFGPGIRSYFRPVPAPAPPPPPPAPSAIQITPPPAPAPAPQVLVHLTPPVYTEAPAPTVPVSTATVTPEVPGSAAAASPAPAAADTTGGFDAFLNWLTEETVFPGYPNGLAFAGGVIGALWLFGGRKKGRR